MSLSPWLQDAWRLLAYDDCGPLRPPSRALAFLSAGYGWIQRLRRALYRRRILSSTVLPVPVVSVGNLAVGGVGKTPFTLYLAERLAARGYLPAILFRGYRRKSTGSRILLPGTFDPPHVEECGDEAAMAHFISAHVVGVGSNRAEVAFQILEQTACNLFLLDDGFQHRSLERHIDLVLFDADCPLGNGRCLPWGPLRESLSALRDAHACVLRGPSDSPFVWPERNAIPIFRGDVEWRGLISLRDWFVHEEKRKIAPGAFSSHRVRLVSGLAHPGRLEAQAESHGFEIIQHVRFPDHHWFSVEDIRRVENLAPSLPILMTEKDAIRLLPLEPSLSSSILDRIQVILAVWRMEDESAFLDWLLSRLADNFDHS